MEQLVVLQEKDVELAALRKELEEIPLRKQQIEARMQAQASGLAAVEEAHAAAGLRIKGLEGESEALKERIAKYRTQQMQIKSNEEYKALEKEIALAQSAVLKMEDDQLLAMEEMDAAKAAVGTRRVDYEREKSHVVEDLAAFDVRAEALAAELALAEEERGALAAQVDPVWLARYERILAKLRGRAVALVERGTCMGCHMKLSPSQVVDSRKMDAMTTCAFCGRILYSR